MSSEVEGKTIAGRYLVGALIASGLTEDLYQGTNVLTDRPVIIKLLPATESADNAAATRFLANKRAEGKLSHPNLLNLTDLGSDEDGTPYAVFENVEVETLRSYLDSKGALASGEAVDIVTQAANGIGAASQGGIVHGGISPANILVPTAPGYVKVFDFGASDAYLHQNPAYSAPEQIKGEMRDQPADVYSLGAVLYEMLAGEPPFSGEDPGEKLKNILDEPPPPLSAFRHDLPVTIEPTMLKALAKDPAQRYQNVDEFAAALTSSETAAVAVPTNNNLWKTAFIVLAGIAILSAALIYATSVKQTDPRTQLQPDANGQPVQPINPATGAQEQALANMAGMPSEVLANSNMAVPPGTLPGGDGYDPWKNGGQPPPGAPKIGPGGQVITIDPNNPSQFMPNEGGVILVPVPANTAVKPTPTPKNAANTSVQPSPNPKATPQTKPTPATEKTPKPATQKTPAPTTKPSPGKPGEVG